MQLPQLDCAFGMCASLNPLGVVADPELIWRLLDSYYVNADRKTHNNQLSVGNSSDNGANYRTLSRSNFPEQRYWFFFDVYF